MNHFAVLPHKLSSLSLTDFMSGWDKLTGKPHDCFLRKEERDGSSKRQNF